MISELEIQNIKRDQKLTDLLSSLNFKLEKHGNDLKTLCPFHEDKNPSLIITPSKNLWHCMSCNEGGSIIDFIMKYKGLPFLAALEQLKKNNPVNPVKKNRRIPRAKLLERVLCFYQKTFKEDQRGLEYLKSRGISDPSIFENFRIGFCNGTLFKAIPGNGEIVEHLKEIGILQENNRESFENCVVFPLLNESGVVVSLYGRKIDSIHHSPSTIHHLYLSGPRRGLINGNVLKSYPEIILTESILDSLSLYQAGIKNTVPCFGVNGFTPYHLEQLKSNKTQDVIIVFDNDETGKQGSLNLKKQLQDHLFSCEIKELPKEKDLNAFLIKHGEEKLHSILAAKKKNCSTQNRFEIEDGFLMKFCNRKYVIRGIEGTTSRLRANIKAENCSKFHIDTFDLYSAKARKNFVKDASFVFKEDIEIIENDIISLIGSVEQYLKTRSERPENKGQMTDKQRSEALKFGKSSNLIEKIFKDTEILGYLGEETNKFVSYLAMTSRKMNDPLSVMILSASGAGKSALQDTILSLCPEEDLMKLTTLTERALFYKESDSLKHKVMSITEEAGAIDAGYAIRNLISSKELNIEATIRDSMTGRLTTMTNTVKGPTAVFKTTTNPRTNAETRSRFIILSVDESRDQTRRVLAYQREMFTIEGFIASQKKTQIINKHKNFQRLLRPVAIFNPYARLLTYQDNKLWVRRDNPKYLQLINAIAFLHQLQRPLKRKNGIEYIEVTLEDIALGNQIASEILGRSLDDLSSPARKLFQLIKTLAEEKKENVPISRREIRTACGCGETYIRSILKELVSMDYLVPVRGGWGKSFQYELCRSLMDEDQKKFLNCLTNVEVLRDRAEKLGIKT